MSLWVKGNGQLINMDNVEYLYVEDIELSNDRHRYCVRFNSGKDSWCRFQYTSLERCEEIIDEIQQHIEYIEDAKAYNTSTNYKWETDTMRYYKSVYVMPKE